MDVQVGMIVAPITPGGSKIPTRIVQQADEQMTVDFNHPLAGESLT